MTDKLPGWISENLPRELVESTLFRFDVKLQVVDKYGCKTCRKIFLPQDVNQSNPKCDECGETLRSIKRNVEVDMVTAVDLDYEALEQQMQEWPAQYAFWSAAYSEARMQVALDERRLKATRGRLTELANKRAKEEGIKLSVQHVKDIVEADVQLMKDDERLQKSQMQCGKLYHMMEAIKMKAELGRSLAGFKRQELERAE